MNKRFINTLLLIDNSGSMKPYQEEIYNSVVELLDNLEKRNESAEDAEFRVALAFFNNNVKECVLAPIAPAMLKALIDEKMFECGGGTNLTEALSFIDRQFSRTSEFFVHRHSGDPMTFTLVITDFEGTDNDAKRDEALNRLSTNRFYFGSNNTLVIFTGSDATKQDAAVLAGGEENVIALNGHISDYLSFVAIQSTFIMSDATHINQDVNGLICELSNAAQAEAIVERIEEGRDSVDNIAKNSDEINDEISKLIAGK